jgi:hypothetical protein
VAQWPRQEENNVWIESHFANFEDNKKAFEKVYQWLAPGGFLLLGVQPAHQNLEAMPLKHGEVYSHQVRFELPLIKKDYFVKKNDEILAQNHCTFRQFSTREKEALLKMNGLTELGLDSNKKLLIFQKTT